MRALILGLLLITAASLPIDAAREMAYTTALKRAKTLYGPSAILRQELDTADNGNWRKQIIVQPFGFAFVRGSGLTWDAAFADAAKRAPANGSPLAQ